MQLPGSRIEVQLDSLTVGSCGGSEALRVAMDELRSPAWPRSDELRESEKDGCGLSSCSPGGGFATTCTKAPHQ